MTLNNINSVKLKKIKQISHTNLTNHLNDDDEIKGDDDYYLNILQILQLMRWVREIICGVVAAEQNLSTHTTHLKKINALRFLDVNARVSYRTYIYKYICVLYIIMRCSTRNIYAKINVSPKLRVCAVRARLFRTTESVQA